MMGWWSQRVIRWRVLVLVGAALFMVLGALWGTGIFAHVVDGGFDDPRSESSRATAELDAGIGRTDADVILLVANSRLTVEDPSYRSAVDDAVRQLPAGEVATVRSYWSTKSASFVSADKRSTFVAITVTDPNTRRELSAYDPVKKSLTTQGYTVKVGGSAVINDDISERVKADIGRAETISLPVLLVLLVVIFGSVVSASLPLLIGGISILGAFTALRVISIFTDVSVFAINIVTIMGLGLAIDYGLFMVGRFREELAGGADPETATRRTLQTAGRTVAISAVTVSVALAGLTLFPQTFLRSMGFGGIAAVLVAALGAVVVLPAALVLLGARIDRFRVRPARRAARIGDQHGFWFRLAHSVMRRPAGYLIASGLVLIFLALPFLNVRFGGIDERVLPAGSQARQVSEELRTDFPQSGASPIIVALRLAAPLESAQGEQAVARYVNAVRTLPGAAGAQLRAGSGNIARVEVTYPGASLDQQAKSLVSRVRSLPPRPGIRQVLVGGETAMLIDRLDSIGGILPKMAGLVGVATFVLLFLAFGSVLLPLKAILLNILSLGASFGVVTWIFQDGHLANVLHFTPTGALEATQPILVLAIVFGISMDYEVFLLSRIREQYDLTGDNSEAVAAGLQRTGSIITSAALLIIIVIAAFSASSITFIKLIGVAMGTSIVVDALLVRMIVVPAAMRLMGSLNWWAPTPLRRLYVRYGIRDDESSEKPASIPSLSH
ncbi:MAG: trehalose monomycolate/heme transporter [Pseudonocardiales bacterium]|nr:trehalose monomycolate/heme transporter [Pseudonocardiales bacterium]